MKHPLKFDHSKKDIFEAIGTTPDELSEAFDDKNNELHRVSKILNVMMDNGHISKDGLGAMIATFSFMTGNTSGYVSEMIEKYLDSLDADNVDAVLKKCEEE